MSIELEREFRRCVISRADFEQAYAYLDCYMLGAHDDVVRRALLSSAVISYARPFSGNRSGGRTPARDKLPIDVGAILGTDQLELHHKVLLCRSKGIAHSDTDVNPSHRVPRRDSAVMSWSIPFDLMNQGIDVSMFRALAWRLAGECFRQMEQIDKQLPERTDGPPRIHIPLSEGVTKISVSLKSMFDIGEGPDKDR